jgi:D-aspartate ligase
MTDGGGPKAACAPAGEHWPQAGTGAVVIGAAYGALGIVRSLGQRGIPVWVAHGRGQLVGAVSRYVRRRLPWPADEAARLDCLLGLAIRHHLDGWAIYPTDDETSALVARHEQLLSKHFRLTTPPWEVLRWAYDKRLTYSLAADLGIAHPWTRLPRSREEVAALDCAFPAILKPAFKDRINPFTLAKAWRVEDRRQLLERYDQACELIDPHSIMVQELIPGGGEAQFSFASLCADGRVLAWAVARRARQYPIDFGAASTLVETVDNPAIEKAARRLLAAIGFSGLVELEFKIDPRTDQAKLLDINPRTWLWHTLARRAGVDFPYLSWRALHGSEVQETGARPGVRWLRAITDLPAAITEIRKGRLSLGAYLRSLRPPFECAVFALNDPLPALVDVPSLLYRFWRYRRAGAPSPEGPEAVTAAMRDGLRS